MNPKDEKQLAQALKEEAGAAPEFSALLHDRILARVAGVKVSAVPRRKPARGYRLRYYAAAAVVLIACSMGYLVFNAKPVRQPPIPGNRIGRVPAIARDTVFDLPQTSAELVTPILNRIDEAKYGYLDRDAARLQEFIVHQLQIGVAFIDTAGKDAQDQGHAGNGSDGR